MIEVVILFARARASCMFLSGCENIFLANQRAYFLKPVF